MSTHRLLTCADVIAFAGTLQVNNTFWSFGGDAGDALLAMETVLCDQIRAALLCAEKRKALRVVMTQHGVPASCYESML